MKQAIVLDVDGVLLSWSDGFDLWMRENGETVVDGHAQRWDMTDKFPNLSADEIAAAIDDFNESSLFGQLPMVRGAYDGVQKLREMFQDRPLVAVTSAGCRPTSVAMRCGNVAIFGLDEIFVLPLGESKEMWLRRYGPGSIMIEDNLKNALAAHALGYRTILLDYPYNQGETPDGVIRIKSWDFILDALYRVKRQDREVA